MYFSISHLVYKVGVSQVNSEFVSLVGLESHLVLFLPTEPAGTTSRLPHTPSIEMGMEIPSSSQLCGKASWLSLSSASPSSLDVCYSTTNR